MTQVCSEHSSCLKKIAYMLARSLQKMASRKGTWFSNEKMCRDQDEKTCKLLFTVSSRGPERFFWCHNDTSLGHYVCRITIPVRFSGFCSWQWWSSLMALNVNAFLQDIMNYRLSIITVLMNMQCTWKVWWSLAENAVQNIRGEILYNAREQNKKMYLTSQSEQC